MIVLPNMGLVKWDNINDAFSHEQLAANFQTLDTHDHTEGKGVKIPYGGLAEQSVGPENLRESVINRPVHFYEPKVVTAEQEYTSSSYGFMPTADEVPNVNVPANALLLIQYDAIWKSSIASAARASIFLSANQLKVSVHEFTAPVTSAAVSASEAGVSRRLFTVPAGLMGNNAGEVSPPTNVTTGQALAHIDRGGNKMKMELNAEIVEFDWGAVAHPSIWGGFAIIKVDPGTYTVGVKYKCSSGNVKAKERRLWPIVLGSTS